MLQLVERVWLGGLSVSTRRKRTLLPKAYKLPHVLCFAVHDILLQFLISGEASGVFIATFDLTDEEVNSLKAHGDIFDWLESAGRVVDRARILKTTILPAVHSDMLLCVYEALQASSKAKLNVSFILLRKPLQETLFLLESIVIDELDFALKLAANPLLLRPRNAGGLDGHKKRIQRVIGALGEDGRFDAAYIAQLRYSKAEDGFDGVCNKAMHLFTEHKDILTERLNINFFFSTWEAKLTQWAFLYTRLPYLLVYCMCIVEYIGKDIGTTTPEYLEDVSRRVGALVVLWSQGIPKRYYAEPLEKFVKETSRRLLHHCETMKCRDPTKRDLRRMAYSGALPGESATDVAARLARFAELAAMGREAFPKKG